MKLKLNQVIPYSGYGLKGYFNGKLDIVTEICFEHGIISSLNHGNVLLKDFKPIFKPLSDLTKEIEIDGVMINPLIKIQTSNDNANDLCCRISDIINKLSYKQSLLLFEWHFDVFGLIPEDLAVDKNTLK